jgi:hypothetical protein
LVSRFHWEVGTACLLLLGVLPRPSGAQDWRMAIHAGLVKEPVLGLLNLPDVVTAECVPTATVALLRSGPSSTAPLAGSLQHSQPCELTVQRSGSGGGDALPTSESGYELPAAIVLQREGRWFRIALQQGSSWIERANSDDFLPYPDLLQERLTYIRAGWDGRIWKIPDTSDVIPIPAEWRRYLTQDVPIEFLDSRRLGDQTWILVRLDPSDRCGETLEGVSAVSGWIPAHRASGAPSAWFYSRGC